MAILYLLNSADVTIKGITITGAGEAHCSPALKNALALLQLANREIDEIPIACGNPEPSDGFHAFPEPWRLNADTLGGAPLPAI